MYKVWEQGWRSGESTCFHLCGPGLNPQESFRKQVEVDRPGERSPE